LVGDFTTLSCVGAHTHRVSKRAEKKPEESEERKSKKKEMMMMKKAISPMIKSKVLHSRSPFRRPVRAARRSAHPNPRPNRSLSPKRNRLHAFLNLSPDH
jgi:hypothetical protein